MGWTPPLFVGEGPRPSDKAGETEDAGFEALASPEPQGVFIGNLPGSATSELLTELLLQAGPLAGDVRLPKDATGTGHRGFAFAEYSDPSSTLYAIALFDGLNFGGRPLRVNASGGGRGGVQLVNPTLDALREVAMNPNAWNGDVSPSCVGDPYGHFGESRRLGRSHSRSRSHRRRSSRSRSYSRSRRRHAPPSSSCSPRRRRRSRSKSHEKRRRPRSFSPRSRSFSPQRRREHHGKSYRQSHKDRHVDYFRDRQRLHLETNTEWEPQLNDRQHCTPRYH